MLILLRYLDSLDTVWTSMSPRLWLVTISTSQGQLNSVLVYI